MLRVLLFLYIVINTEVRNSVFHHELEIVKKKKILKDKTIDPEIQYIIKHDFCQGKSCFIHLLLFSEELLNM